MAKKKTARKEPDKRDNASIVAAPSPIPEDLRDAIEKLEKATNKDVWLLIEGPLSIRDFLFEMFRKQKSRFSGKDIVLVVDSFGGAGGGCLSDWSIVPPIMRVGYSRRAAVC